MCDRVAIVDHGCMLAEPPDDDLIGAPGREPARHGDRPDLVDRPAAFGKTAIDGERRTIAGPQH